MSTNTIDSSRTKLVNFCPYGHESTASNQNKFTSSSSSSVGDLPLDVIIDDIEHQMNGHNHAIVGMTKQLEDIEICLSRQKKLPPRSLPFVRKSSYISMDDDDDGDDRNIAIGNTVKKENKSSSLSSSLEKQSILRMIQRTVAGTETRRNNINNDGPMISSTNFEIREIVPPSQVQNLRRNLKVQSQVPGGFPVAQELPPPPPREDFTFSSDERNTVSFGQTSQLNLSSAPKFRSSLTWDESVSSHHSGVSDDLISELENTDAGKTMFFHSRKAKYALICLAGILFLLIGILMGQWAQAQAGTRSQQPSQQQHQISDSPSTIPTTIDNAVLEEEKISASERSEVPVETLAPSIKASTTAPVTTPIKELVVIEGKTNPNASQSGFDYTANTNFLVGVYYYPWHGERFHNGGGYMRKELEPQHVPALGEYNDSDPAIIKEHMKMFRQANIGLLVTSWWGPNRVEDSNTKDIIMEHEDAGNLKIAIHYETTSRLGSGRDKLSNAKTDIKYMCENYFDHPNYYKIDGRPVLFLYISRKLHSVGTLEEALLTMRSTASKCGHNLYLIGDSVFEEAPDSNIPHVPFWYFDAVTNYDIYGSSGRPEGNVGTDRVDNYYRQQGEWKEQALREDCRYIPATSPGYNDRGVRMENDHPPLSRRITSTSKEGSLFHYQLQQAKKLADSKLDNMILVNSFNEWHEDTQIEPVVGDPSSEPFNFTKGLEYEGYGELYLDILGAATSKDKNLHHKFDYLL